jgi:hypothetical protein
VGQTLAVLDAKLGGIIKEKLDIACVHKCVAVVCVCVERPSWWCVCVCVCVCARAPCACLWRCLHTHTRDHVPADATCVGCCRCICDLCLRRLRPPPPTHTQLCGAGARARRAQPAQRPHQVRLAWCCCFTRSSDRHTACGGCQHAPGALAAAPAQRTHAHTSVTPASHQQPGGSTAR